jgi:hypothetical protein
MSNMSVLFGLLSSGNWILIGRQLQFMQPSYGCCWGNHCDSYPY